MKGKRFAAAAGVTMVAIAAGGATSLAASAPVPIAKNLANPRQMAFAPNGSLHVALAGSGRWHAKHAGGCATDPEGGIACAGDTAGIERITSPGTAVAGAGRRVQFGLLSIGDKGSKGTPAGSSAVGLDAVSFAPNGSEWGIFTFAPPKVLSGLPSWVKNDSGRLVRISSSGTVRPVANVAAFSLKHPNAGHAPDTDPYGVLALNDRVFIADAANNTILLWRNNKLTTLRVFPYRHGDGSDHSFDTVPTSLATDGKHLFVGTLGSFIPGQGKVYELSFSGKLIRTISGLSQVTSVAVDGHGNVFATEIFGGQQGPFDSKGNPTGLLVKVTPKGAQSTTTVPLPGGVAVRGGHVYVSVFSVSPTQGAVWRLR